MKSKKINILYILSFIMLQFYICESLAFVSNGFVESISLALSDDLKDYSSFIFTLLVSTKNIIILSILINEFYNHLTTERTYRIIRYKEKKLYGKKILLDLIKNIIKLNIFIILVVLLINIIIFKSFLFDINLLYVILGNLLYLTFKFMIFVLITSIFSFYFSRNLSLVFTSLIYIIFSMIKNNQITKVYSPLYYLDFYRENFVIYKEVIRFSLVLFVLIFLIKIFLRTIDNRDIIYFRRDYE